MSSLQPQTKKIKKRSKKSPNDPQNFVCGECNKSYKYYPGLYLHIRKKHGGIRPSGTKIIRNCRALDLKVKTGRPKKGETDIDELSEDELCLEIAQAELLNFLGEKLEVIKRMGPKDSLEDVATKVLEVSGQYNDKWLAKLAEESKKFLTEYKERDLKMQNLDFEDDFVSLDPTKSFQVIVWFMMWLGKVYVKAEFIQDLVVICSRVWKVTEETEISAQDLDNKLVWKKVVKDCEESKYRFSKFKEDYGLLTEFVKMVCQLIGKVFEGKAN